jgi:hypothetical protein
MTKLPTVQRGIITQKGIGEATRAALAAVEGRPVGVLATLFAKIDEAHAQATARVEELERHKGAMIGEIDAEIETARRDLAATTTLIMIRDGKPLPGAPRAIAGPAAKKAIKTAPKTGGGTTSSGMREPRGDVPRAITALLEKNGVGLSRADIITKLKLSVDKAGQTAVSNFLAASKKKGRIIHEDDGTYRLNV